MLYIYNLHMTLINDTPSLKRKTIQKISKTVRMTKIVLNMRIKSISKIHHNDSSSYYLYTHFLTFFFFMTYFFIFIDIIAQYLLIAYFFDKVKILFTKDFLLIDTSI